MKRNINNLCFLVLQYLIGLQDFMKSSRLEEDTKLARGHSFTHGPYEAFVRDQEPPLRSRNPKGQERMMMSLITKKSETIGVSAGRICMTASGIDYHYKR